jgi:hypothetical protein
MGIVREIGVHLDDGGAGLGFEAAGDPGEAGDVGGAEAELAGALEEEEFFVIGRVTADPGGRAVAGGVIDEKDFGVGQRGPEAGREVGKVFLLVIGRDDDEG